MCSPEKYNPALRILHWVLASAVIAILVSGFVMTGYLVSHLKFVVYRKHKPIVMIIGLLMLLRLVIRAYSNVPETQFSRSKTIIVSCASFTLCFNDWGCFSGYLMSSSAGKAISWFGIFELYLLACPVILHISAALKHLGVDKRTFSSEYFSLFPVACVHRGIFPD